MAKNSLTLVDNRTDKTYEIPIKDSTIRAKDLRQIKVEEDEFGMMSYDPSFENTASCKSSVTFIDGDKGILRYRGFPIEQLAEHSSQLEVSKLLIDGELPNTQELKRWVQDISDNSGCNCLRDLLPFRGQSVEPNCLRNRSGNPCPRHPTLGQKCRGGSGESHTKVRPRHYSKQRWNDHPPDAANFN